MIRRATWCTLQQIGPLALDVVVIILIERKRPDPLAATLPHIDQRHQPFAAVGKDAAVTAAERPFAGTGQGGVVDQQIRGILRRHHQRISQHHPPLRIGIDHFDGGTVDGRDDLPGPIGMRADMVLGNRQPAVYLVG